MPVRKKYTLLTDDLGEMESLVDDTDVASFEWPAQDDASSSRSKSYASRSTIEEPQPFSVTVHNTHNAFGSSTDNLDGESSDAAARRSRALPKYMYRDYYASIETEENIKCMVSSALFVALVVIVIVVTFVVNPQM